MLSELGIFTLGTANISNMIAILKQNAWKRKQLLYIIQKVKLESAGEQEVWLLERKFSNRWRRKQDDSRNSACQ